ncbi:hypothetical protein ATG_12760 [Desulfurococcaceae archaeon AG1]|nr:hypothetical protein ATG_12760 [Desulfurococcaceae archaeon AG1]
MRLVIIDLGAIHIHSLRELKSLAIQIELTNSIVVRKLGTRVIAVAPMKTMGLDYIEASSLRSGYRLLVAPMERVIDMLGAKRVIVMDPYGEHDLRVEDLEWAEAVVLGGIVDRTPIKGITTLLRNMGLPWAPTMRITLRGSILGVPSEINNIAAILIKALEVGSLENAIKEIQPKRDAIARASAEIPRLLRSLGRSPSIEDLVEIYKSLRTWLNLDSIGMMRALIRCGRRDLASMWREKIIAGEIISEKPEQAVLSFTKN